MKVFVTKSAKLELDEAETHSLQVALRVYTNWFAEHSRTMGEDLNKSYGGESINDLHAAAALAATIINEL